MAAQKNPGPLPVETAGNYARNWKVTSGQVSPAELLGVKLSPDLFLANGCLGMIHDGNQETANEQQPLLHHPDAFTTIDQPPWHELHHLSNKISTVLGEEPRERQAAMEALRFSAVLWTLTARQRLVV